MNQSEISIKGLTVVAKLALFVFGAVLFMPMMLTLPAGEYGMRVAAALERYVSEALECRLITEEQKQELLIILYR